MSAAARRMPAWLTYGFRPFFLAAALWAALALAVWIVMLMQGMALPSRFDPLTWHIHEMLFGFVMAAIGGFLLTAIANWTARPPVRGGLLALLSGLWLLGRIACLVSADIPLWLSVSMDLAFPIVLTAVCARELVGGAKFRNLMLLLPLTVLMAANLLMHLEAAGMPLAQGLGWRLGLAAIMVLISVIGGRIIPAFTRNWLVKKEIARLPVPHGPMDRIALGALHTGILLWAFLPESRWSGALLLAAAASNAWRLWRWHGPATAEEPLLLILHIGYGWLVAGIALLGLSVLDIGVPQSAAIHALTVGAIGTMILAVMTRATRGHTGRPLVADGTTVLIFGLVSAAALVRIAASILVTWPMLLIVSASFWIAAFLAFVLGYGRALITPREA